MGRLRQCCFSGPLTQEGALGAEFGAEARHVDGAGREAGFGRDGSGLSGGLPLPV